ncbi:hypothetical protein EJB05_14924, partial [Eragrostis curvula]
MAAPPRRVIICGGGVVGACTAYFLSTHASSPTVPTLFEKCAPACAASGKAGGFLALDWCDSDPSLSALSRASFALHHRLAAALDGAAAYGFRPVHALAVCVPEPGPHPLVPSCRGVLDPAAAAASPLLPAWVDPAASAAPAREVAAPGTTAQVHPGLFTKAVLAASGAEVVIGEVERVVVRDDGRVAGVAVKKGRDGAVVVVDADAVVLALGPWTGRLEVARELGVSGLKGHSIVLRPRQPEKITPHALFLTYQPEPGAETLAPDVFPRPDGEVYIGGLSKAEDAPDDPATITGEPDLIATLHKVAGKVSSHLNVEEGAEVVAEQACYRPWTADGLPIIGEMPGVKGCYVATGHGRWGILNATATVLVVNGSIYRFVLCAGSIVGEATVVGGISVSDPCVGIYPRNPGFIFKLWFSRPTRVPGSRSRRKDKDGKVKQEYFDEDQYSVDTADPIREYFGIDVDEESQKLLFVSVEKVKRHVYVDKMYLATSTIEFLLKKNDFKISATANGNIYVCTATEADAKVSVIVTEIRVLSFFEIPEF